MKLLKKICWLLPLIALVACTQTNPPDPSMTSVGGNQGAGDYEDWISPEDIDRAQGAGLELRDSAFGSMSDANRVEGLLPSVYFDFDQSFIRPADRPALQQAAEYLMANPADRLLIEGYCDWRGTTEYNMALGDRRATSVMQYLTNLGVPANRVEVVSMGDLEAETEATEAQMQQDRRADLVVLKP